MNDEIEETIFVTGRVRKLGSLYLNNIKAEVVNTQDIILYNGGLIDIKDSEKNDDNKISWVEVNDNEKKLLICNKNLIKGISWNELNAQNPTPVLSHISFMERLESEYRDMASLYFNSALMFTL